MSITDVITEIKARTDIVDLAGQYTELHKHGTNEWAGPCPVAGCPADTDGFHVHNAGWWKCYTCHPKRSDMFELIQLLHGCSFREAMDELSHTVRSTPTVRNLMVPRTKIHGSPTQPEDWRIDAAEVLRESQEYLASDAGQPGRDYLLGRGLAPNTWRNFGLGYTRNASGKGPAIAMPWFDNRRLVAIRYRLLDPVDDQKIVSLKGSRYSGRLFGEQALDIHFPEHSTLVLCEGEINAMSISQVHSETRLGALSLGSESSALSQGVVDYSGRFRTVFVWADRSEVSSQLCRAIAGAHGVFSRHGDANDLLVKGLLGGFLAAHRANAANDDCELEGLLWDIWDAAHFTEGIDGGTARIAVRLASELGKDAPLLEAEPGRWTTVRTA